VEGTTYRRGIAFINCFSAEEARRLVEALNGQRFKNVPLVARLVPPRPSSWVRRAERERAVA
jgi:hypothetical protein